MGLDTRAAALQWERSYKRATWMQAPLAIISLICGAALSFLGAGVGWLLAGTLLGAVVPFTLIGIRATNNKLLERGRDLSSPETRNLLVRWGRLHAIRTALSLVGTILYLSLLLDA